MTLRRALAGAALLLGVGAAVIGTPPRHVDPAATDVRTLARQITNEEDHVTALELARWIRERRPALRVVDLRPAEEFEEYHIPGAQQASLESLVAMRFSPGETIVLYSQGGAHAAQGWVFLRSLGHERAYFLSGGLDEWVETVMNPVIPPNASREQKEVAELSRYFGGVPRRGDAVSPAPIHRAKDLRRRGC